MSQSDLTFITNEDSKSLLERFRVLIKDARYFDVLVGYFFASGFHSLYKALENTEKIRILVGIGTDRDTADWINLSKRQGQAKLVFSHAEVKDRFSDDISREMELSEDSRVVEEGVSRFIEWLASGKLEIKAYPEENLHAKLYLMTFKEGDRDLGRVITGSSNFTKAGLSENLEFNVELKNKSDFEFAQKKFNELWGSAADVKGKFLDTIETRTWLNSAITPYQLFLKFLYEYFKGEISQPDEIFFKYAPIEFKKLEYQEQAVLNAKKILEEYGGVFISDVVGLGKTFMSALLANQLDGRSLVLAPPVLLDKDNPGSWPNVFSDFKIAADFESLGKLGGAIERGVGKYKNIFIDEAHRFRAETNITYEKLAQICRGKRVVLVTATPLNNSPKDILSQIKLFQQSKKSAIPNLPDLENFFSRLEKKLKELDRQRDRDEYIRVSRENAREIREKVVKYLMVRRTRKEIETYFGEDLKRQGLNFPEVADPEEVFYELNDEEDRVFTKTIEFIVRDFKYARYTPLLPEYFKGDKIDQLEIQSQKNMGKFMKILLVKRLESSFFAFRNSVSRFIFSYKRFLEEFEGGYVYVSKKHANKVFDLLENDDEASVQKLIDEDKARKFESGDFTEKFSEDLRSDLEILAKIEEMWEGVERDPKFLKFAEILKTQKILKKNKLVVFTESRETADYLVTKLKERIPGGVVSFSGQSGAAVREQVIANFDAKARNPKDDFRILVATEVLAEGVNLHRSNVVINYDIPWNPTRIMQRVGRVNRVDTGFSRIHTYNFFPSRQGNDQIKLREAAEAKIHAFIALLGADARLLTEGEDIESHELFSRLTSKKTITGEDDEEESSLKYLKIIRDIRDNDPDLFSQIKRLPKKARTARKDAKHGDSLLTYFRKGKLDKFYLAEKNRESRELDFVEAANALEVPCDAKRETLGSGYYDLLDKNKAGFLRATTEETRETKKAKGGQDSALQLLKILKAVLKDSRRFTEGQEMFLKKAIKQLEEGGLPKQTAKTALKEINKVLEDFSNPLKLVAVLQKNIPPELLESHFSGRSADTSGPTEVILSEYFVGK